MIKIICTNGFKNVIIYISVFLYIHLCVAIKISADCRLIYAGHDFCIIYRGHLPPCLLIFFNRERSFAMKCPYCGFPESKVVDSRPAEEGTTIRRRRECQSCQKRFTTYEIIERIPLVVVKKDGRRQTFDKVKLLNGMIRACEKRPVTVAELQEVADNIEQEVQNSLEREVSSSEIGELVMKELKTLDEVAYVRFASVYRQFKDINTFMEELNKILQEK